MFYENLAYLAPARGSDITANRAPPRPSPSEQLAPACPLGLHDPPLKSGLFLPGVHLLVPSKPQPRPKVPLWPSLPRCRWEPLPPCSLLLGQLCRPHLVSRQTSCVSAPRLRCTYHRGSGLSLEYGLAPQRLCTRRFRVTAARRWVTYGDLRFHQLGFGPAFIKTRIQKEVCKPQGPSSIWEALTSPHPPSGHTKRQAHPG